VIPGSEVELGKISSAMELIQKFLHHGDGKLVLDGDGVECAVVDAKPPRAVVLSDKKYGDENADVLRRMIPRRSMSEH
jgi:hypothetical protein